MTICLTCDADVQTEPSDIPVTSEEFQQRISEKCDVAGSDHHHILEYIMIPGPRSFACPECGRVSHNINDIREGYCGFCHDWTRKE